MSLEEKLWDACRAGELAKVKRLVAAGVDIHARDDYALRGAAWNGHLDVIKYLIEVGADLHARDDMALCIVAAQGHFEVVKYLCEVYIERYGIAWCLTSSLEELREFCKELV